MTMIHIKYADKGSRSQCQSTVFKKAKDQERNHASRVQEQTTLVTPEAGESIDQQKTLYCRTVFWHNQTLIQNGARQLLRYGKSQRPSHTEKYLHESEKSSQQNLRRSIIKETLIKSQELVKYEVDRNHCKGAH